MKWRNIPNIEMPLPEKTDPIETAIFAAELSPDTPNVDLHELDVHMALDVLGNFLHKQFGGLPRKDTKVVKIIHGRGEGGLQQAVADYLTRSKKFVVRFRTSDDPTQANGVTYAVLAPNKK